ncbi:MAG TPA: alpha/beta hydrolase [Chloroflexota bacterium]|nr:alpha/beta hydrolase [Chloroflexota bacterium]
MATEHDLATPLGTLHYVRQGNGPALVALHGMAASSWSWSRSLPLLATRFDVYAPDLLGHGQSEARRDAVSVEHHAAAVSALLRAAGIERCILAGAALGAMVALETALLEPERVAAALLLGVPNFRSPADRSAWLASRAAGFVDAQGLGIPMGEPAVRERYKTFTPSLVDELNAERARAGLWALHDVWAIAAYDAQASAARLSQPAAFCWGSHDPFLSGKEGLVSAAPAATHVVLDGAGHYPAWDAPEATLELALQVAAAGKLL